MFALNESKMNIAQTWDCYTHTLVHIVNQPIQHDNYTEANMVAKLDLSGVTQASHSFKTNWHRI